MPSDATLCGPAQIQRRYQVAGNGAGESDDQAGRARPDQKHRQEARHQREQASKQDELSDAKLNAGTL